MASNSPPLPSSQQLRARDDALLAQISALHVRIAALHTERRQLTGLLSAAVEREHEERLATDPEYVREQRERRDRAQAHAERRLADRFPSLKDFDRAKRALVDRDYQIQLDESVCTAKLYRGFSDTVCMHHVGPRGGHHGDCNIAPEDAPQLAALVKEFIAAYPVAYADRQTLALTRELSGFEFTLSFKPREGIYLRTEDGDPLDMFLMPEALHNLAQLLGRPVTVGWERASRR